MKSIKLKLFSAFVCIVVVMMLGSIVFGLVNVHLSNQFKSVSDVLLQGDAIITTTKQLIRNFYYAASTISDSGKMDAYVEKKAELAEIFDFLNDELSGKESRIALRGIRNIVHTIIKKCDVGISYVQDGETTHTSAIFEEVNRISTYLYDNTTKLVLNEQKDLEELQENLARSQYVFFFVGLGVFFSVAALGVVAAFIFSSKLTTPIVALSRVVSDVADGDLSIMLDKTLLAAQDEIGVLSRSFDVMLSNLKMKMTEVTEEREKFFTLFQASNDAIFLMKDGAYVDANETAFEMFGADKRHIIGETPVKFSPPIQPSGDMSSQKAQEKIQLALSGEPQFFEWKHCTYTGKPFDAEVSLNRIELNGEFYMQVIVHDVSERKKAEQERLRLQKELTQAQRLEAIGTLAAGVAHEINTPVQYVSDNVGFVKKGVDMLIEALRPLVDTCEDRGKIDFLIGELPESMESIDEGLKRITQVVNAMKIFSHVDSEERKVANLNDLIESTITVCRNEWKYVADVCVDLEKELPPVPCCVASINQVIVNLIINAVHSVQDKFGERPDGEKLGVIHVRTTHTDEVIRMSVEDNGVGISEKIRDRIFDPFFTTKDVGRGTGQGLSLAYSVVVETHGGKIWCESEVGRGATFFLELPREDKITIPTTEA